MSQLLIYQRVRLCANLLWFDLDSTNRGYLPSVKRQIVDLALNGSGIRDTARVLCISKDTVLSELKKRKGYRTGQQGGAEARASRQYYSGYSEGRRSRA